MSFASKHSKATKISIFSAIVVFAGLALAFSFFFQGQRKEISPESNNATADETSYKQEEKEKAEKEQKKEEATVDIPKATQKSSENYMNLYPDLYVEKPDKQVIPNKTIFLTFDDGPSERTKEVLDILKKKDIKATFFVVGNASAEGKALMKQIVEEGHTIAPHSYTHEFKKIYSSVESFLDDFYKIYKLIYDTTGQKPSIFRFAGGSKNSYNKNNYKEIIAEMLRRGFFYYDWNLSTGDAAQKALTPVDKCLSNVLNYSAKYNSAVILMHDAKPKTTTVQALPQLIDRLKDQGFSFDRLTNEISPTNYSLIKPYA
ncbi:MAG: polysaccharide deacetylase [Clostridia bacterium]|nr:polysaccharide deacetylase [Clostridia bacterium]